LRERLRPLRVVCTALAAGVLACAGLVAGLVPRGWAGPPAKAPFSALSLALTFFAMILLLLASRLRGMILGQARRPALAPRAAMSPPAPPAEDNGAMLAAYARATLLSFGLLAAVGGAGLAVGLLSGSALYGLVLCGAGFLGMLARWPRAAEVERLARRLS
jgi:hypothetical protein